jgi:hydroxypyruvate isomerase
MNTCLNNKELTRRSALTLAAGAAGALLAGGAEADPQPPEKPLKGRIHQSASRWCYGGFALDALCERGKAMGLVGIDLLGEGDWETVKQHGLICTMAYGIGSIPDGWNRPENHDRLVAEAEKMIPKVAKAGLPNIITFSGNRRGLSDAQGMENCVTGLKRIARLAEDNKVTVCIELLNSRHDHKDYQFDHIGWGVEMCKRVGSERVKILYDIYHAQIMDGDICVNIKENIAYIAHFHTGGVPGRREIDDTQELNYTRVCRAIAEAGFKGYLAHEFNPSRDPMASLQQAIQICDV